MLIAQVSGSSSSFLEFLESVAPYVFGGIGTGAGLFLKFLTEREKRKIEIAQKRIEQLGVCEVRERHQREALTSILAQCEALEHFGATFEEGQVTARQLLVLKAGLDKIQATTEDILDDGIFRNETPRR